MNFKGVMLCDRPMDAPSAPPINDRPFIAAPIKTPSPLGYPLPLKPGPQAQGHRKPTVFGKHKKWLKQKAEEQRRAKEAEDETKGMFEEKKGVLAKKAEQLRSAILSNQSEDVVIEDLDGFHASPVKRRHQSKQSQRPPLHQLSRTQAQTSRGGGGGVDGVGAEAAMPLAAEEAEETAAAAAAEARRRRRASKAAEAAKHAKLEVDSDHPYGFDAGGDGEFDHLIDDAIVKAKRLSPKKNPAAAAAGGATNINHIRLVNGAVREGGAVGNGAIEYIELPPPADHPEQPASDAADQPHDDTAAKSPASAAPGARGLLRKKKSTPAWALAPEQAKVREEDEEEDLLSFAEGLDFDKFEADMDEEDRSLAMERLEVVEEVFVRPRTSEQHYNAMNPLEEDSYFIGGGDGRPVSRWKGEFVRKMNDMANQEAAKEAAANRAARSEAGGQSAGGENATPAGLTYGSGNDRLRRVEPSEGRRRARFAPNVRERDDQWDGSTRGADLSERHQLSNELGDAQYILSENPDLQRVHSTASVRSVLKKSGVPLARAEQQQPWTREPGHQGRHGGGDGGGAGYDLDHHVPAGMVDGTDILIRARNDRMRMQSPQQQQTRHWLKMEDVDDWGDVGANSNHNNGNSPSKSAGALGGGGGGGGGLPRHATSATSSRPSTSSALYAIPEGRPLTAKVTEAFGVQKDLGHSVHPAMPLNPILAPRSVGDGKASFMQEYHKLMLDRGGLLPPDPAYVNPTLWNESSGDVPGVSLRRARRMLQMGIQGLNPPKHDPDFNHRF